MSNTRRNARNEELSDRQLQGGVADIESISQRIVDTAVNALREELIKSINTATQILKAELTKQLTDALNHMDERISSLEERFEQLESGTATASSPVEDTEAIKRDAREAIIIANDVEQYTRRSNVRIRGLAVPETEDCKQVVVNFLTHKLHIQNLNPSDIEVAHTLPTGHNRATSSQQQRNTDRSDSTNRGPIVIVRFHAREVRDNVLRQRRQLKGTKFTIIEDLTTLNVKTLNRARNHDSVTKTWTWNGKIYAINRLNQKLVVRPFQPINDCTIISS